MRLPLNARHWALEKALDKKEKQEWRLVCFGTGGPALGRGQGTPQATCGGSAIWAGPGPAGFWRSRGHPAGRSHTSNFSRHINWLRGLEPGSARCFPQLDRPDSFKSWILHLPLERLDGAKVGLRQRGQPVSKCLQSGTCSGSARAASRCHPAKGRRGRPRNAAQGAVRQCLVQRCITTNTVKCGGMKKRRISKP
jgi:hypothetical protein